MAVFYRGVKRRRLGEGNEENWRPRIWFYAMKCGRGGCASSDKGRFERMGLDFIKRRTWEMEKVIVSTERAPKAIGPYSQAVRVGNMVFISGQLGMDPESGEMRSDVASQTRQSLDNIGAILNSLGLTYDHVVKTTVFLKDLEDFSTVNGIYGEIFSQNAPARSCVEVSRLPKRGLVEIECIAVYPGA